MNFFKVFKQDKLLMELAGYKENAEMKFSLLV